MQLVSKYFWVFFILGIFAGIFLPTMAIFSSYLLYMLMFVLFLSCLKIDLDTLFKKVKNLKLIIYLVLLILIIIPFIVHFSFGFLEPEYSLAILLLAVMPAGMAVPVYSVIFKGDGELALLVTIITSLLCPFTIPLILNYLIGVQTNIDFFQMFSSLGIVVFIPFFLSLFVRKLASQLVDKTEKYYSSLSVIIISLIIAGAVSKVDLSLISSGLVLPFISLFFFAMLLHVFGYYSVYKANKKSRITSSLAMAYMNSTLAIIFAAQFFGEKTLLLVTLYQIPANLVLIGFGKILNNQPSIKA